MKLYEAPKSRDTHFLGAKDRYPAEPTLCGRKPSVGVLVGAYHQAHSISERMPFEHVVFYFNNFNLVVIIRIFSDISKIQLHVYSVQIVMFMT
jgi:hypothetical protein